MGTMGLKVLTLAELYLWPPPDNISQAVFVHLWPPVLLITFAEQCLHLAHLMR